MTLITSVAFFGCGSVLWGLDVVSQWPCDVCDRSSESSAVGRFRKPNFRLVFFFLFFLGLHCGLPMVHDFFLYYWSLGLRLMLSVASCLKESLLPLIYRFRFYIGYCGWRA